jgi:hypothetical protein
MTKFKKILDICARVCYNNYRKLRKGEQKMFIDDFDIMITPEELGFDYSELLEEIEM